LREKGLRMEDAADFQFKAGNAVFVLLADAVDDFHFSGDKLESSACEADGNLFIRERVIASMNCQHNIIPIRIFLKALPGQLLRSR
jgi:hypothetical protein